MPMRAGYYDKRIDVFDGSSAQSSTLTQTLFIGDFVQMSASWTTSSVTDASRLTTTVSNEDGFGSAISAFHAYNSYAGGGGRIISDITPGPRWLRVTRGSEESMSQVILFGRTRT